MGSGWDRKCPPGYFWEFRSSQTGKVLSPWTGQSRWPGGSELVVTVCTCWGPSGVPRCGRKEPASRLEHRLSLKCLLPNPGSGRSPGEGNGNLLQFSCLGNPMHRGTWWATVHGITESQTWLRDWRTATSHFGVSHWGWCYSDPQLLPNSCPSPLPLTALLGPQLLFPLPSKCMVFTIHWNDQVTQLMEIHLSEYLSVAMGQKYPPNRTHVFSPDCCVIQLDGDHLISEW